MSRSTFWPGNGVDDDKLEAEDLTIDGNPGPLQVQFWMYLPGGGFYDPAVNFYIEADGVTVDGPWTFDLGAISAGYAEGTINRLNFDLVNIGWAQTVTIHIVNSNYFGNVDFSIDTWWGSQISAFVKSDGVWKPAVIYLNTAEFGMIMVKPWIEQGGNWVHAYRPNEYFP